MADDELPTTMTRRAAQDAEVAARLEEIAPSDAAAELDGMSAERAADMAEYLDPETAALIVSQLHPERAGQVVEQMEAPEAAVMLQQMDPDDRVDVLDQLSDSKHDAIVGELDEPARLEVQTLEKFAPDTAGGIMTTQVTALYEYVSAGDAVEVLRSIHEELEQMFYVYVIDRRGHLVGVLSMRDLILSRPATLLRDIMIPRVVSVPASMDQEEVARLMHDKRYLALPVVDADKRLIGLITADDISDVFQEEATEDVLKLFGAGAEERLSSPWHFSFKKRFWWLVVNLLTAFMAAAVVRMFDNTLQQLVILAAYMPIVAGMGGNASAQAMAVAVRGLAIGRVDGKLLRHVITRELYVGLLTGIIIGIITGAIAFVFPGEDVSMGEAGMLGLVVFLALLFNHTLACTTGASIPFAMKKLGFDPAQSATIFATTVTDVCGFLALLGLASLILI
jgi:magnesium transporter